jgi:hypothetical protein
MQFDAQTQLLERYGLVERMPTIEAISSTRITSAAIATQPRFT